MDWTGKPRRLERVFATHAFPVYFVTAVTAGRKPVLANAAAHDSLIHYARKNSDHGRAMGRYVLMPDHLHFMVRLQPESKLADYVRLLRQSMTIALHDADVVAEGCPVWQPGFFDRLLRSSERHGRAWEYMLENPVNAGLARVPADWPYQGEIIKIRF